MSVSLGRSKFYVPRQGDLVVGIVTKRTADYYKVDIGAARDALLPCTAFNGASKQNSPSLEAGSTVLAGIANADVGHELMLSCVVADEVKTWSSRECYLGELPGGLVTKLPIDICNLLLEQDNAALHLLGEQMKYEIAIGQNGYYWLNAGSAGDVLKAQNLLEQALWRKDVSSFEELERIFVGPNCEIID